MRRRGLVYTSFDTPWFVQVGTNYRGWLKVDETYLGELEEGVRGRKTEKKALIAVGTEENGKGIGRI